MKLLWSALTLLILIDVSYALDARATFSFGVAPSWSPDGRKIAYQSSNYDIWLMSNDGSEKTALISDIYRDEQPAFSPDGRIAFVSERNGKQEIWVMNRDGSDKKQVTSGEGWKHSPSWSSDGKLAYILSLEQNGQGDIFVLDQSGERQLTQEKTARSPSWSPDGKKIAYVSTSSLNPGSYEIWTIDFEGNKELLSSDGYWKGQLSWSPDGKKIAYVSYRSNYDIWVLNLETMEQKQLTDNKFWQVSPSWSPDGKKIAYVSDENGVYDIFVTGLDSSLPPLIEEIPSPSPVAAPAEVAVEKSVETTVKEIETLENVVKEKVKLPEYQKPVLQTKNKDYKQFVLLAAFGLCFIILKDAMIVRREIALIGLIVAYMERRKPLLKKY